MTEASSGKMPMTVERLLISLWTRSSGLVEAILPQWAREGGVGGDVGFGVSERLGGVGIPGLQHPHYLAQLFSGGFGVERRSSPCDA